jgi:transcriptional regulator with XRE-family HTH domain
MIPNQHWTSTTLEDFAYWVTSDFTAQIETRLEEKGISKSTFAKRLDVSPSRVSQVLNDPGNLTLGNVVKYPRVLGMKVALVVYEDNDPDNGKGPINADVFTRCWERMGCPREIFDLENMTQSRGCWVLTKTVSAVNDRSKIGKVKVENTAAANTLAAAATVGGEWRRRA